MIINKQMKFEKSYIYAYIGFILLNFYYGFADTILYNSILNIFLIFSIALFLIQLMFYKRFHIKKILPVVLIIGIFIYNYLYQKDSRILVLIVALLGMKKCKLDNMLKILLYEKILIFLFTILVSSLGFNGFIMKGDEYILGYIHGNLFTLNILEIVLLYICLNWKKMNMFSNISVILILFGTFFITGSRTGILISAIVYVLFLLVKYTEKYRFIRLLSWILLPFMFIMSIVVPYSLIPKYKSFYEGKEWLYNLIEKVNGIITNRLTLAALKLDNTNIKMFSSESTGDLSLYKYTVVDSGYVQLLLVYGLVGSVIFIVTYMLMIYKIGKLYISNKEKYIYLLCFIAMELYAFTENSLCSFKYNFTFLFALLLFNSKSKIMEKFNNGKFFNFYNRSRI